MEQYAIIVAGGSGSRMQSKVPKQFLEIEGKPILMHTLMRFFEAVPNIKIITVLPPQEIETWKFLCKKHEFSVPHQVVGGGSTRFHSVKNGLAVCPHEGLVAIHDGVRPFVSKRAIIESFEVAQSKGNAVLSVPLKDSLRFKHQNGATQAVNRSAYVAVQTPQTFQLSIIKPCFESPYQEFFTDDATVAEYHGIPIYLIEGDEENIKITTPLDKLWAEVYLKSKRISQENNLQRAGDSNP
ncbi:MAG: 2-C-methyl-D-erythritol 4-phosphate cytidylyltransferase [Cytophagales bacterium]|nr:2-C-methyl-D-erythritol 4-phosphate cytidylyltransferase [Cytophagales bacterium]MDW8383690.1 2-C-methyl-D-erythritol 4-phosphate cytidylyltransferase [Flammeovirgaceae bacterium]